MSTTTEPRVQDMLAEWLTTLGFEAMARDVAQEQEWARLQRYARVILKQLAEPTKRQVWRHFVTLRLV